MHSNIKWKHKQQMEVNLKNQLQFAIQFTGRNNEKYAIYQQNVFFGNNTNNNFLVFRYCGLC